MVLKPDVIHVRLAKLEEVITGLEELRASHSEDSFRDTWAIERGLHLAAECLFDTGNHVLSAHFGVIPGGLSRSLRGVSLRP